MVGGALLRPEENTLRVWCCDYIIVVFYGARIFCQKKRTLIEILYSAIPTLGTQGFCCIVSAPVAGMGMSVAHAEHAEARRLSVNGIHRVHDYNNLCVSAPSA